MIDASIFRAYDIRGVVDESLTEETVENIGWALGSEALDRNENTIIIGRDGRLSGERLSNALCKGILKSGCDVIDIGAVPTPTLYFATHLLPSQSGVMLTGSHNPPEYNGIKMVLGGETLSNEAIQKLYLRIVNNDLHTGSGELSQRSVCDEYIDDICQRIHLEKKIKVVIDCGNGIGGLIAPKLFQQLGCDVEQLFCEVDGNFPNHHPDPSQPENLKQLIEAVKKHNADLGISFDGDADRLGLVTNTGNIIWPDRQLMLFAIDVLSRNPGAEIIYDVKCTKHLKDVISEHGGVPCMCKTGHSFVKAELKSRKDALLGGEMSGHMFFKERWYGFDDALYAGARLLEIVSQKNETVDEIFNALPNSVNTPELKLNISDAEKFIFMDKLKESAVFPEGEVTTIDGIRVDFPDGFGLIRPSNTTPCLVLRFEADDEAGLQRIQNQFREQLLKIDASLELPF